MSKKKRTEEKTLVGLVNEWINLDNPERIEESVRKWTNKDHKNGKSSKREFPSRKYVSILTQPYRRK